MNNNASNMRFVAKNKVIKRSVVRIFLFVSAICLLFFTSCKHHQAESKLLPVEVEIKVIDSVAGELVHTYIGAIEESQAVALSFPIGGRVEQIFVGEGDRVQKGQIIASINKENAKNAYNSAKSSLQQAEDAYNRLKKVYEQGSLAEIKWVEIQTTLEKARSMEQIAKKQLEDCTLTAPISGIIGTCNAKAGGSLLPGEPAVVILETSAVFASFAVPENEISDIKIGDVAYVSVPALDNRRVLGRISEKGVSASSFSHNCKVKIPLENPDKSLIPGMVCNIFMHKNDKSGFVVPSKCVQTRQDGLSLWVIENGRAQHRSIKASEFVADGVFVSDGVNLGDTIVVAGMQKLYVGAECVTVNREN